MELPTFERLRNICRAGLALTLLLSCLSALAAAPQEPCDIYFSKLKTASTPEQYWDVVDAEIQQAFQTEIFGGGYWSGRMIDRLPSFRRDLVNKFGFELGDPPKIPSAKEILKRYEDHLNSLVRSGAIQENEVLRPVFVFKGPNGEWLDRKFGEAVPSGLVPRNVIPNEVFFRLVAQGKFPIGDHMPTTTRVPTFVHDVIGHFGGFLERPDFMKYIRKYAELRSAGKAPELDQRGYFFSEGLTLINPERREYLLGQMLLPGKWKGFLGKMLPGRWKSQPEKITLQEMIAHLNSVPKAQLVELRKRLADLVKDSDVVQVVGGAGREPFSASVNIFHSPLYTLSRKMFDLHSGAEGEAAVSVEGVARMQVALAHMSSLTSRDWFESLLAEKIPEESPVMKLLRSGAFKNVAADLSDSGDPENTLLKAFGL